MDNLSQEQRAHDIALLLLQYNFPDDVVPCDEISVFNIVKDYEHFYKYALDSLEEEL